MPVSRRRQYGLKAAAAYAIVATAWILLSDSVLMHFSDAQTVARYGTFKGVAFVLATAAILWFTLMNAPTDSDARSQFTEANRRTDVWVALAWGMTVPSLAALLQWTAWDQLRPFAWLLGYPAVLVAAWLGGWLAGLTSTGISAALTWLVFAPTHPEWLSRQPSAMIAMGVFVAMGVLISLGIEWVQRTERRSGHGMFQALVEQSLAGIYAIKDERFTYVNPEFARIMGFDNPQDIVGRIPVADLVADADRDRVRHMITERLNTPGKEVRYGFTGLRRDGSKVEVEVHGRSVRTDQGPLIVGLMLDVTDQRRHERTLREQQAIQDRMSILAKVGGWSLDLINGEGTRTRGAARILDLDPDDPASLRIKEGLSPFAPEHQTQILSALERAVHAGESYALEVPLTTATGRRKWIRTQGEPVREHGKVVRIDGAIQDISEVQQARQALQAHHERLEHMVKARTIELEAARLEAENLALIKSRFLANMSHEIRTPLNGVLGLAQLGAREHQGPAQQVFEQISASGRLLLGVLNDILDFSKIEEGKLRIQQAPLRPREVMDHAVLLVRDRAIEKGLRLLVELDPDLPQVCLGDSLRLEQILLNLLSNAVKFTDRGEVRLMAHARGEQWQLTVQDTGIGIRADHMATLFQPFEQADDSNTRQHGGTGLGLAITQRLVSLLGGHIDTSSTPGAGTRFVVTLPLVRLPPPDEQQGLEGEGAGAGKGVGTGVMGTPHPVAPRLAGLRVLAAEDNAINQLVLKEMLALEGASVTLCAHGAELLEQLDRHGADAFDLVLMDIQMPVMDGYEATQALCERAPTLPVIGLTAHALAEEHARCMAVGMVDLVVKPIDMTLLVDAILRHARPQA